MKQPERLAALERRVRGLQALVLILLASIAVGMVLPDKEEVVLHDQEGRPRLKLGWNEAGGPGVFLLDEHGVERAAFEISRGESHRPEEWIPRLLLRYAEGHRSVELAHIDGLQHGPYRSLGFFEFDSDGTLVRLSTGGGMPFSFGELYLGDALDMGSISMRRIGQFGPLLEVKHNERTAEHEYGASPAGMVRFIGGADPLIQLRGPEGSRTITTGD